MTDTNNPGQAEKAKEIHRKAIGFTEWVRRKVRQEAIEKEAVEKLKPDTIIGNPGGVDVTSRSTK